MVDETEYNEIAVEECGNGNTGLGLKGKYYIADNEIIIIDNVVDSSISNSTNSSNDCDTVSSKIVSSKQSNNQIDLDKKTTKTTKTVIRDGDSNDTIEIEKEETTEEEMEIETETSNSNCKNTCVRNQRSYATCGNIKISQENDNSDDVIIDSVYHKDHIDYIVKRTVKSGDLKTELLVERYNTKYHTEKERLITYWDNGTMIYEMKDDVVSSILKTSEGNYLSIKPVTNNFNGVTIKQLLESRSSKLKTMLCDNKLYVNLADCGRSILERATCIDVVYDSDGISEILLENTNPICETYEFKNKIVNVSIKIDDAFQILMDDSYISKSSTEDGVLKYVVIRNLNNMNLTESLHLPSTSASYSKDYRINI